MNMMPVLAFLLLLLPGCTFFRDGRPEPTGSPCSGQVREQQKIYSSTEAVNAAVSAISLRIAASSRGPFRIIPAEGKTTVLGFQVLDSLARMRLSRISAPTMLRLEDVRTEENQWSIALRTQDGRIFIRREFQLKGDSHAGRP